MEEANRDKSARTFGRPCAVSDLTIVLAQVPHEGRRSRRFRRLRGAIYARYSSRYQYSVEDQIRQCKTYAEHNGIDIRNHLVFADRAERGCKRRRKAFQELQQALDSGQIDVVLVLATNRLFRKTCRSLQFVEEEIVEQGRRCIFVAQKIDTADEDSWRTLLQVAAMMDELGVRMNVAHSHASHQGLLLQGMVYGTITFGYRGELSKARGLGGAGRVHRWPLTQRQPSGSRRCFSGSCSIF